MSMPSALVIGGGGGIGSAVCRRLATTHAVAVGYRRNAGRAASVVDAIAAEGGAAVAVGADVATDEGAAHAVAAAAELGELRAVVHLSLIHI